MNILRTQRCKKFYVQREMDNAELQQIHLASDAQ